VGTANGHAPAENSVGTAGLRAFAFRPGNPGGRPKSFAAYVREQTADGRELVDFVLAVLRGRKRAPMKVRLEAATWLADRGWGTPRQVHEVSGPDGAPVVFTLKLGERELGGEAARADGEG
jgi:hypothetical protein